MHMSCTNLGFVYNAQCTTHGTMSDIPYTRTVCNKANNVRDAERSQSVPSCHITSSFPPLDLILFLLFLFLILPALLSFLLFFFFPFFLLLIALDDLPSLLHRL